MISLRYLLFLLLYLLFAIVSPWNLHASLFTSYSPQTVLLMSQYNIEKKTKKIASHDVSWTRTLILGKKESKTTLFAMPILLLSSCSSIVFPSSVITSSLNFVISSLFFVIECCYSISIKPIEATVTHALVHMVADEVCAARQVSNVELLTDV